MSFLFYFHFKIKIVNLSIFNREKQNQLFLESRLRVPESTTQTITPRGIRFKTKNIVNATTDFKTN